MDNAILNNNYKAFSFDVFDTCISRIYEKPTDLFFHLGILLSKNFVSKKISSHDYAEYFMKARILAERKANRIHGRKRSCKFEEIYSLIDLPNYYTHSKIEMMQMEKHLEFEASYAIEETKNLILELRKSEARIIFISDMYHDSDFIKSLLIKNNIFREGDSLYVSSQNSLTKRSGLLFKHVLNNENLKAHEILHTGDDFHADISPAHRAGIKSQHIKNTSIKETEIIVKDTFFSPIERRLNSISKYIRLRNPNIYSDDELELFSIIAPAILSFSLWSLKTAERFGLERLYFVSRDGELPYKVAKALESPHPKVESKLLFGSRKAWLLPSLLLADENWKNLAAPPKSTCSLKDILERLSFTSEEILCIKSILEKECISIDTPQDSQTTLEDFSRAEENFQFKKLLTEKIGQAKELAIKYLEQEGLFKDQLWATVDSGWALNCQASLNRIIKSNSTDSTVRGFYFGLGRKHLPKQLTGPVYSFTHKTSVFSRRRDVVESCFLMSTLMSTIEYKLIENTVEPVFSGIRPKGIELDYAKKLHQFTLDYANTIKTINFPPAFFVENKDVFITNLANLISKPTREVALYLSNIHVNADTRHTENHMYPLCKRLSLRDIFEIAVGFFIPQKVKPHFWLEASATLSNPILALLARTMVYCDNTRLFLLDLRLKLKK